MNKGLMSVVAAASLFACAGGVYAQCSNPTVTMGNLSIIPGNTDSGNHADDLATAISLPFPVTFYGVQYNSANVSSNGNIQFATANGGFGNVCLPAAGYGPAIFPHWDDQRTDGIAPGIFTGLSGTPGSQIFTVDFQTVYYAANTVQLRYAVQFHENSSTIDFIYDNIPNGGISATVGTQDGLGNFYQVACDAGGISNGTSMTFDCIPVGACCTVSGCGIATAANCASSGGTYNGDNTNCGVGTYAIGAGGGSFNSIAGSGSILGIASGCDDCTESINLPFTFNFFGTNYTSAFVSSNGNIQFGNGPSAAYINDAIPSGAAPNNAIYPLWDDYNPLQQGDVYMLVEGSSPNQTVTIEWNNVTQYTAGNVYPLTSETFQAILREDNSVEFRYGTISPTDTSGVGQGTGVDSSGGDRTIGVENISGTVAFSIPSNGFSGQSQMVTFIPPPNVCGSRCGTSDFDGDGDSGTDQDIEAFFACLSGNCCATCFAGGADFDGDGDTGTDQDIEAFFRVLAGNPC